MRNIQQKIEGRKVGAGSLYVGSHETGGNGFHADDVVMMYLDVP